MNFKKFFSHHLVRVTHQKFEKATVNQNDTNEKPHERYEIIHAYFHLTFNQQTNNYENTFNLK